jgi:hypothetical protein
VSRPFSTMDEKSRVFYSGVFAEALLNIQAVRRGVFDTYLSETEDPSVARRWKQALPTIVRQLMVMQKKDAP